jgi:rhamnosyltransferase
VIDNTEQTGKLDSIGLDSRIDFVANGANLGVATAINQGIEVLIARECDYAVLLDQDSEPSDYLLHALVRTMESQLSCGKKVALVGPTYEDKRLGGVTPFVRFRPWRLQRIVPTGSSPVEVDFLITSGSCLNLAAWPVIGPMDDALFIDFVDLEWCVRARLKGYSVLGAPALRLSHSLGGEPVRAFGRAYPGHSAIRHYYQFRNAIALLKRSYMPWSWKSTELVKLPGRLVIYGLFMSPRVEHLRMALLGMWHGLIGQLGIWGRS